FADGCAHDLGEMGGASKLLAHFVGKRTNVGAGGTLHRETRHGSVNTEKAKLENFNVDRFQLHWLLLTGQLMRGTAVDFFGGKRGWRLLEFAREASYKPLENVFVQVRIGVGAEWGAVRVVGIRGEPEAEGAFITLAAASIKLCEARGAAQEQNQNSSGQRIERSQVADLAKTERAT